MTVLRQNRQALLLYKTTWLKGQIEGSLSFSKTNHYIIILDNHLSTWYHLDLCLKSSETMISNPHQGPKYQIFLASKNKGGGEWVSVLYTVLIWSCIDHVINMIDQARFCWEQKNSGILSIQNSWRSNVYSSFFFNRARFPLARLPLLYSLGIITIQDILDNISFALGHRFLSGATRIQPRSGEEQK